MTKLTVSKAAFPNSLTALNLFCGFLSIVYSDKLELQTAAFLIIAASVFDSLDGIAARLVKTTSKFGVELDSLADVISFGAAPSFLVYKAYLFQFGYAGMIVSSMLAVFGAFRLARFNVTLTNIETKGDFTGLPIPLQAITICFFIISFFRDNAITEPFQYFLIPLIVLLSFLMVSNVGYKGLPKLTNKTIGEKLLYLLILVLGVVLAVITKGIALFYLFIGIILFGLFKHFLLNFLQVTKK